MAPAAECTHCRVTMTSWSAPGSPIRYYQCPFCARTHSSLYGEVFRHGAGARLVEAAPCPAPPAGPPLASAEEIQWAGVRARAARWFARLDQDQRRGAAPAPRSGQGTSPAPAVQVATAAAGARPARQR
jgi:hypothetical protein